MYVEVHFLTSYLFDCIIVNELTHSWNVLYLLITLVSRQSLYFWIGVHWFWPLELLPSRRCKIAVIYIPLKFRWLLDYDRKRYSSMFLGYLLLLTNKCYAQYSLPCMNHRHISTFQMSVSKSMPILLYVVTVFASYSSGKSIHYLFL